MVAGVNCDRNNIRKFTDEPRSFTRLFHPGLGHEHVEQITGNANEVEVWSLFDQPAKPVKAEVEIGG
jgi:hypothetical protein